MPVCSYLVIPDAGATHALARSLDALPGCDVTQAENQDLILLVTDTPTPEADRELRSSIEELKGIHALVLTFGEIDPETEEADPLAAGRGKRRRRLPVVDPGGLHPAPTGPVPSDASAAGGSER